MAELLPQQRKQNNLPCLQTTINRANPIPPNARSVSLPQRNGLGKPATVTIWNGWRRTAAETSTIKNPPLWFKVGKARRRRVGWGIKKFPRGREDGFISNRAGRIRFGAEERADEDEWRGFRRRPTGSRLKKCADLGWKDAGENRRGIERLSIPLALVYRARTAYTSLKCEFQTTDGAPELFVLFYKFCYYIGVTRSGKIESDRNYQKNKARVQELKISWKKEKLHSTINKYIEKFDTNTITSFYFTSSHF